MPTPKPLRPLILLALLFVGAGCCAPTNPGYFAVIPKFTTNNMEFLSCDYQEAIEMAQGHVVIKQMASECQ